MSTNTNPRIDQYIKGEEWTLLETTGKSTIINNSAFSCFLVISDEQPTEKCGYGVIGIELLPFTTLPMDVTGLTVYAASRWNMSTGLTFE